MCCFHESGFPVPDQCFCQASWAPSIQPLTPYAAVPPSLPVPPARPSRFCSPSFSRGPSRRPSASPARHRRRSRSPAQSSPAQVPDQSLGPGSSRLFCPVAACPDHAPPSHGWASFHSIRPHIEAHMAGQLLGEVPPDWLRSQGFGTCEVCQRILSLRYNGRCPSCFHVLAPSHDHPTDSRPLAEGAPTIWDVFTSGPRVRSSVPAGARDAWSRCLVIALSDIVAHRDARSWTDLLTLPALVLAAPSRGGRRHTVRADADTRRRCLDWINGVRGDLWSPERGRRGRPRPGPDADMAGDALPESVVSRVSTLIQEGALRRACAALLQDPPVSPSGDVVSSLRALHPSPRADERANLGLLRRVSPCAAPVADIDQVRKAVHSFPSTSGAGRSGLRPSHFRDALRPASSDLLLRLHH